MHLSRSIAGVLTMSLWFVAFAFLPVATAMTLNYTSPIWMALILAIAPIIRKQPSKIASPLIFTILISFVGVVCLLQPTIASDQWLGGVFGLTSGMVAALAYLSVRRLGQYGEPETRIVFYLSLTGLVVGGVWIILTGITPHTTPGFMLLMALGTFATLGQLALTRAYRYGNPLLVANFHYMGIVFAAIWGIIIWQDSLNSLSWAGIVLIIGGGICASFFRMRVQTTRKVI
jgi:S-adenosylmethionine uptake transporter